MANVNCVSACGFTQGLVEGDKVEQSSGRLRLSRDLAVIALLEIKFAVAFKTGNLTWSASVPNAHLSNYAVRTQAVLNHILNKTYEFPPGTLAYLSGRHS